MSTAGLMNGTQLANDIFERTAERAADFLARTGTRPCLATVIVGDDPASVTYVKMKENRSHRVGIESRHTGIPAAAATLDVVDAITRLSEDPTVHGILLQHPSPPQVDESAAFEAISPGKDVDGVTMHSFAAMALGRPGFVSCTPGGILRLLDAYEVELVGPARGGHWPQPDPGQAGRDAAAGAGRHRHLLPLEDRGIFPSIVRTADIVVAAVGRPNFVQGDWLEPRRGGDRCRLQPGQPGRCGLRRGGRAGQPHHPGARRGGSDDHRPADGADNGRRLPADRLVMTRRW